MRFIIIVTVGLAAGCIPQYRAPTFDQPHATLKLKRSYALSKGTSLSERMAVDGSWAFAITMPSSVAAEPRTDTLLLHPRPARLLVTSVFFDEESQADQEPTLVSVPYDDVESYDCGTFDNPRPPRQVPNTSWSQPQPETTRTIRNW